MRTVKFRAWCRNMQEMIEVTDLHISEKNPWVKDGFGGFAKNFELLQWTGLKDKNGIEIYEGDIIYSDNMFVAGVPLIVEYSDGCFFGKMPDKAAEHEVQGLRNLTDQPCKVIGNIYENPELLKGAI